MEPGNFRTKPLLTHDVEMLTGSVLGEYALVNKRVGKLYFQVIRAFGYSSVLRYPFYNKRGTLDAPLTLRSQQNSSFMKQQPHCSSIILHVAFAMMFRLGGQLLTPVVFIMAVRASDAG
jgi:hypothetical protein